METVNRAGKSYANTIYTLSAIPNEEFEAAYALWKMGAPIEAVAEHLGVADPDRLGRAFAVRHRITGPHGWRSRW
jgi:hypothetical protein